MAAPYPRGGGKTGLFSLLIRPPPSASTSRPSATTSTPTLTNPSPGAAAQPLSNYAVASLSFDITQPQDPSDGHNPRITQALSMLRLRSNQRQPNRAGWGNAVRLLLEAGADAELVDGGGRGPLHFLCSFDEEDMKDIAGSYGGAVAHQNC